MANETACHYDKLMGFFYNNRNQTKPDWDPMQLIVVKSFGFFFSSFILASNGLVVAAVIINKRFHFPFYYLVANLATSDFLAGIAYIYLTFNTGSVSRELSLKLYFLRQGLLDTSLSASLANLLAIALERYLAITSWKVHSNLTKRRVMPLIILVWVFSLFMGAVPSLGWNCVCDLEQCSSLAPVFSRSYLVFWSGINLLLFLFMAVIYIRIYAHVKIKTLTLSASVSLNRKKAPMKLIKTVMAVLGVFVVCWTPGLVVLLLDGVDCQRCSVLVFKRWLLLLAIVNSVLNPIIYTYKDKDMRQTLWSMLRCVCVRPRSLQTQANGHIHRFQLDIGSFSQNNEENNGPNQDS